MRYRASIGVLALAVVTGCAEPAKPAATPGAPKLRSGRLMIEVGARFDHAWRAYEGKRWDALAYEIRELGEAFDDASDGASWLSNVEAPKLKQMFHDETLPALAAAADKHDVAAMAKSLAAAAGACNDCHHATGKAFVVVSAQTGATTL